MFNSKIASSDERPACHRRLPISGPSLGVLVIILVLLNTSCGTASGAGQGSNPPQTLAISGSLPDGAPNQPYNSVLVVSGGNAPYQFAVKSGILPKGVALNPLTGSISGTPLAEGTYSFEIGVTDAPRPDQGSQSLAISITPGGGKGIKVTVAPSDVSLISNQTQQFTATVSGTRNTAVTWSASVGSIDHNGLYTAPMVNQLTNGVVTATSLADNTKQGNAAVTVDKANGNGLTITTNSLPDGQMGNMYNEVFAATGGKQPYSWSISGNVPPGIVLSSGSGDFAGLPGGTGTFSFTVKVTDAGAQTAQKNFVLNITAGTNFDGPAELPRVTVSSSLADTPAPGNKIVVSSGGNPQTALNNAQCGDTVELQAGASFTGTFTFPARSCDDNHWIIVRTSAPDSVLPAEGQRLTPCFAGVTSLPGRPQYVCSNPQNVMAKLVFAGSADGPVILQSGANHYRLIGLEITRAEGVKASPMLIGVEKGGSADHIIVDRSWLHGTTHDETRTGVGVSGLNYVAVVDSYFSDFHCTSRSGSCTDAHAVGGGNGDHQGGPYKIENSFVEASGEGIIFGGAPATTTPTDIVIRRNHFFKPMQWKKGSPNFVGGVSGDPFIVKNHLELKNAIRVLVEANLMENSWGGFSQTGYGILLTPKNQHSQNQGDVCPICQVTDVTIRYTHISHAGNGIQLATSNSGNGGDGAPAKAGTRWSIHDVVMDDISGQNYVGGGRLFEVQNGWPENPLNTVTINHVTGFADSTGGILIMGNKTTNASMYGFVFTNSIVTTGTYPVWNSGGGPTSCAISDVPIKSLTACFTTYTFGNNVLIAAPPHYPPSSWPTGNLFAPNANGVGFVQYNQGDGGNYQLQPGSPYKNMGTDGRDLGADIVGLDTALTGVE
jgi:hypothetical protein